ncbi:MAG: AAA family ATPase [Bacteroidales bacterium]|nr:AAA family ATPase [Bacteroidales bacterium]
MKRFINHDLEQWKNSRRRKPLILRGARQVGKTYSIRRFGETRFDNFVQVDLERNSGWHKVFEGNLQAKRFC